MISLWQTLICTCDRVFKMCLGKFSEQPDDFNKYLLEWSFLSGNGSSLWLHGKENSWVYFKDIWVLKVVLYLDPADSRVSVGLFWWSWLRMLSERLILIFQLSRRMFLDFLKSPFQQFQNQYENHFFLSVKSPVFYKDETTLQYLIPKLRKSNDCVAVTYAKLSVKVFITVLV